MAKNKVKKQDWEIIDTPYGQWEYPGAITRIPSNQITMQGVPYPVLGVSNTGQSQMMYPNQDYQFDGSSVTEYPLPEAGSGYKVIRSSERKGKTHKVIGPDGTVKFFGDSKLGQHPKDPARKKAFYARHAKNLKNNPYFRAFARKTWEEGGELDFAQEGLSVADKIQLGLDAAQFFPGLGQAAYIASLPFTTYDVAKDIQQGNYKQAGLDALGYIPAFKAFKYGVKGEKLLDTTSKLAKQLAKANMAVNTTNLAVDAKKKTDPDANKPYVQPRIFPGQSVPTMDFAQGGMLPDLMEMAFGGNLMLEKYADGGHGGLDRWFAEKWIDVKTGKPCGRQTGEKRKGYPACRPSKRVSSETPKTSSELSPSEKAKFKREKTSSKKISYQHRRKEEGGSVNNDKEMVEGIADILSQVDNMSNRKQIARNMLSDFKNEGVTYDYSDFLEDSGIPELGSGGNVATNSALWSRAKSLARSKFDVYPCVPMDSQALTKEGWKYYNELTIGEEILAYNQETNKNEWTPIISLQKFEDAPIIRLYKKQTNFDIKCTPNHKWVLAENNSKYPDNLVEAKDITKHMSIKISAELSDNGKGLDLNKFLKKESWVKNILQMSIPQIQSYFASGIVYDGNDKGLDKKENKQTYGFSQKEKDHGLAMEIAAVLLGYRVCSIVKKHNPTIMSWTFIRRNTESTQNLHKEDAGISDVWCPTTKFGTWVMKQNGYVTITGNSAYANAWAAKWYKSKGGGWRKKANGGNVWEILPEAEAGRITLDEFRPKFANSNEVIQQQMLQQKPLEKTLPEVEITATPTLKTKLARAAKSNVYASGRAEYIPIESALLPGSLPIQGSSVLGKAGVFAAEALNPVSGFRSLKGAAKQIPGSGNALENYYKKGLMQLMPEKKYFTGELKHHALKEIKKASLAFSPNTTKALGRLDPAIAEQMLSDYRYGNYPSVEAFRKNVKKAILESERLKKIHPSVDFGKEANTEYKWALKKPETLKQYADIQLMTDKSNASQKSFIDYLGKDYAKKMDLINQNAVFRNIANESPQYTDLIYEHLKNPNISDDEFVTNLVKQSNTFTRALHKPSAPEEFFTLQGKSLSEGTNNTMDLEGFPVSGDYGNFRYKIEPNAERMSEIAATPIEQRWEKRFPETFNNENINLKEGWLFPESEAYKNWRIKRLERNRNVNNVPNIRYPKSGIVPTKYIRYPQHKIFISELDNQVLKGFDLSKIDIENPRQYIPGFTRGFSTGGVIPPAAIIGAAAMQQPQQQKYGGKISNWEIVDDNEWEII